MKWCQTGLSTVLPLVLTLSTVASAHMATYLMPQVPEPERMIIDGEDDDWGWYDDGAFAITPARMFDTQGGPWPPAKDDWDVVLRVAWSAPPDNCLYYFARVIDDSLLVTSASIRNSWKEDALEVIVDADHSSEEFALSESRTGQQYVVRFLPPPGQPDALLVWAANQWSAKDPFFIYSWALDPPDAKPHEQPKGSVVRYTYEVRQQIWDYLDAQGPLGSFLHVFEPGQTIGLTFQFDESENPWKMRELQASTTPSGEAYHDNSYGSDFITVAAPTSADPATAADVTTWGRIKASFRVRN